MCARNIGSRLSTNPYLIPPRDGPSVRTVKPQKRVGRTLDDGQVYLYSLVYATDSGAKKSRPGRRRTKTLIHPLRFPQAAYYRISLYIHGRSTRIRTSPEATTRAAHLRVRIGICDLRGFFGAAKSIFPPKLRITVGKRSVYIVISSLLYIYYIIYLNPHRCFAG